MGFSDAQNFFDDCVPCGNNNIVQSAPFCDLSKAPGGIAAVIFLACGYTISDLTNLGSDGDWQKHFNDFKIAATHCNLKGKLKDSNVTKGQFSSCCTEEIDYIIGGFTADDYYLDCVNHSHADFYNDKNVNQHNYQIAYLTCDNLLYGFYPPCWYTFVATPKGGETKKEKKWVHMDVEICKPLDQTFTKPVRIHGLCQLLKSKSLLGSGK